MKPLLIIQHLTSEPPGYLSTYLQTRNIPHEIICLDEGQTIPGELDQIAGLVFMGGAGSVNDDKSWVIHELDIIRQADAKGLPMLGVCFGAQLISKALGGTVYPAAELEVGWHTVEAVTTPAENTWLEGLPARFDVFQWHAHTFTVPPGASPLWQSHCNKHQGFIKNNILGMQFHLEMTAESIHDLSRRYASDLSQGSECIQTIEYITEGLTSRIDRLHHIADQIYDRWLIARN